MTMNRPRMTTHVALTHGVLLCFGLFAGCAKQPSRSPRAVPRPTPQSKHAAAGRDWRPRFLELVDWTRSAGVRFVHTDGSSGRRYIMETVSCGLALFDYDGDGLTDIYFCNGAPLPPTAAGGAPHDALYRNLGQLQFQDVTAEADIGCTGFGLGIAVADYDNDGYPDVYLNNYGPNRLYRNNGDGTFFDATAQAGLGGAERVGAGVCFLDRDTDGFLDLFAANYVQFSQNNHRAPTRLGRVVYPGPLDYPQETNSMFRNRGDGTWDDVSRQCGVAVKPGTGMGAVAGDFDGDGDTDIYVANDEMANFLYRNDGTGKFDEVGIFSGAAYDDTGSAHGSMGADCGDFDNDGRLDLFVTAYQGELATLYRNLGRGMFQDVTRLTGAGQGTTASVTWGCCLADLDNDGDRDLFIARGHLDDRDANSAYRIPNLVLRNLLIETGTARFVDISAKCGAGLQGRHSSRGVAVDDLDNDGDLDIVVLNSRQRATVLKNLLQENGSKRHWLQLRLHGCDTNRSAVGTRVRVTAGDLVLVDEVHAGRGYQSHWGGRLHFGLGAHAHVDQIEIHWYGAGTTWLRNLPADQLITVSQSKTPH